MTDSNKIFNFDWDSLLSTHETIIFSTDLEPDDLVALIMFREMTKDHKNLKLIFLVGEGNSMIKRDRMKKYIELIGFNKDRYHDQIEVLLGFDSDVDFHFDGRDVLTNERINELRQYKFDFFDEAHLHLLIESHHVNEKPILYISLKPPREIYQIWKQVPKIFQCVTMIGYMSFNLRVLFHNKDEKMMIEDFLSSFKCVLYYETYFASNDSSTSIGLETKGSNILFKELPSFVIKLIKDWNMSTLKHYDELLNDGKQLSEKQIKIKMCIEKNDSLQFVNADNGLIAFLLFDEKEKYIVPSKITFDEKTHFTICSRDEKSHIFVVNPSEDQKDIFFEKQMQIYTFLLEDRKFNHLILKHIHNRAYDSF